MPRAELFSEPLNVIGAAPSRSNELKIHIGCGQHKIAGYINCDLYPTKAADRVFDCQQHWPFPNNCASTIYCSHTLEHLADYEAFFREAHRVLRPDGNLQIRVPYGGHKAAYWDPTHLRPWYAETFCFLQPGYSQSVGNAQHHRWHHYFSVEDAVLRVTGRLIPILKWKLLRRLLLPWLDLFNNAVEELWVYLIPLKTPEAVKAWLAERPGNAICSRYSVYKHHLEERALQAHEVIEFVDWRREMLWNGFHIWKENLKEEWR